MFFQVCKYAMKTTVRDHIILLDINDVRDHNTSLLGLDSLEHVSSPGCVPSLDKQVAMLQYTMDQNTDIQGNFKYLLLINCQKRVDIS